jgi:hypothetical protein
LREYIDSEVYTDDGYDGDDWWDYQEVETACMEGSFQRW